MDTWKLELPLVCVVFLDPVRGGVGGRGEGGRGMGVVEGQRETDKIPLISARWTLAADTVILLSDACGAKGGGGRHEGVERECGAGEGVAEKEIYKVKRENIGIVIRVEWRGSGVEGETESERGGNKHKGVRGEESQ